LPLTYGYNTNHQVTSMKTLVKSSVTATYVYNALGQRIMQSGGGTIQITTLYWYDEAGHLLGEYDGSAGALIQETVWLGDIPVATLRPHTGGGVDIYYVHTDQLNTPRLVTRPSDNKQMWTWFSDPFGTTAPNSNPAGGGTFIYNLRFAGQLYDSQAGLRQNWHRDYDAAVGRYIESDLIGLHGGINTYAFVLSNPLMYRDPLGLAPPTDLLTLIGEIGEISHEAAIATLEYGSAGMGAFLVGHGVGTAVNYACNDCFGGLGGWVYETTHPEPPPPTSNQTPSSCGE